MRTINGNAMQAAGRNPAMNKAATERLVRFPNTTMGMHGGTSIPMADAEATIDTACSGRYPPRLHGRDEDRTHRGDIGDGCAGNPRKDVFPQNRGNPKASAHMADKRPREINETRRDAAGIHQLAHQDKEGDRQEDERVHARR